LSWEKKASQVLQVRVPKGSRILVAVSGGPDSVVLAHFLRRQPYSLVIGHVDHGLRSGSARDARFVQSLARTWDIPFRSKVVDVKGLAQRRARGVEEAARKLRYQALAHLARQCRCTAILTAHTADDQAETVLMNFLRGAGPAGLAGMPERRYLSHAGKVPIVRPLLGVTRREILRTLQETGLPSRQDPSNLSLRFMRNRIRHLTLPSLEKLFPGLAGRLVQSADIYREEEEFWRGLVSSHLRKMVRANGRRITVVLPRLLRYHKALSRRILRRILPGLSFQDIEQVLTLARSPEPVAELQLAGHRYVKRKKNLLVVAWKKRGMDE
jgi:tRNA(Ile)-lysidine synthase